MGDTLHVTDQMGRQVAVPDSPKRIVSLVPSQTEFLIDLGAPVVGRTKFCIHPNDRVRELPIIGGTKNFRFDAIDDLNPDLIIGNREENYQEGIDQLAEKYPVWMSDITSLEDATNMMDALGTICGLPDQSDEIIQNVKRALQKVKHSLTGKVVYLMWKDPWMAVGRDTFINEILIHLGYENLVRKDRYPELTLDEIKQLKPDLILLSSEPYPFKESHVESCRLLFDSECQLVDGELYSWYGSRLTNWD